MINVCIIENVEIHPLIYSNLLRILDPLVLTMTTLHFIYLF